MQLFLAVQEHSAAVGIRPILPGQKTPFNGRSISVLLIYSLFFISATAFLAIDANSFREYAEVFFPWMTLSFVYVGLAINVAMTGGMFGLIAQCQEIIEGGK